MIELRRYQKKIVADLRRELVEKGARAVLVQLGTGGGKTATAAEILRRHAAAGKRAIFVAHLDSLVTDTHERLKRAGVPCGFVQAGRPASPLFPIQVCSTATLYARGERPPCDLLFVDEAHRTPTTMLEAILGAYGPETKIVGLSATPQRFDGKPLGAYQVMISGPTNAQLLRAGFLVPCDVYVPRSTTSGLSADPVAAYFARCPGRRAIVFAETVAHARELERSFTAAGYPAACLLGETSRREREHLRSELRAGRILVLVGVGVFVEGFDEPSIECVVLARSFGHVGVYLQAVGRGLRPSPATGKERCTVLDLRGAALDFGLPEDERRWSLDTGAPVVRTDPVVALTSCKACGAIFRPRAACPRCGAKRTTLERVPTKLTRAEELILWNGVPAETRDRAYLAKLTRVALARGIRRNETEAREWALGRFRNTFKREPVSC